MGYGLIEGWGLYPPVKSRHRVIRQSYFIVKMHFIRGFSQSFIMRVYPRIFIVKMHFIRRLRRFSQIFSVLS